MYMVSDASRLPVHGFAPYRSGLARGHDLIDSREGATRKRRAGQEDVEIGRKIRALRLQRGLSQTSLADGIGLTFQQVQKYEKGTNRVSAGRLQRIADLLETPVMFFYGGAGVSAKKRDKRNEGLAYLQTKGAMRLMRAYGEISSRTTKYALVTLAESLRNKERG
jgi:transcriptional regulator with XRE-family HTH domain